MCDENHIYMHFVHNGNGQGSRIQMTSVSTDTLKSSHITSISTLNLFWHSNLSNTYVLSITVEVICGGAVTKEIIA